MRAWQACLHKQLTIVHRYIPVAAINIKTVVVMIIVMGTERSLAPYKDV